MGKTKEETFQITKFQLKEINEFILMYSKESSEKLKEWFPKAFEQEKDELPKDFTGWCKKSYINFLD